MSPVSPETLPPLWMMRHGQTEWNQAGRLQGWLDSPLTPMGIDQARKAGEKLARIAPPDMLRIASPAGRAVATAQLVFGDADFITDDRLIEIGLGDWSGIHLKTMREQHPDLFSCPGYTWYDSAPGGEKFVGLARRTASFLAELPEMAAGRPVCIVTHGITLRMMRAQIQGLQIIEETHLNFPQGAIHHIEKGQVRIL